MGQGSDANWFNGHALVNIMTPLLLAESLPRNTSTNSSAETGGPL